MSMSTTRFLAPLTFAACLIGGCATEEDINPGATADTFSLTESLRIGDEAVVDNVYCRTFCTVHSLASGT